MEKYGFIYLWLDKKHKKYYVGRHWGTTEDKYICSSRMMRQSYNRRKYDFKRRIISYIYTNNNDLILEEQRWLDMIKKEELGKKYYNKTKFSTSPSTLGYNHSEETKLKIKNSNIGVKRSESTKEANRNATIKQFSDPEQREKMSESVKKLWSNPEYRQLQISKKKGVAQSNSQKDARTNALRKKYSKPIKINGIEYESKWDASEKLNKTVVWCKYHDEYTKTRLNKKDLATVFDLIERKFVCIPKTLYQKNKDRYCGTTSKRIPRS